MPGSSYTDPAVFASEQRTIFERLWLCAARTAEIPGPGRFQVVTAGTESVLIIRQGDGSLRAFLNVCRHRGARVCAEESGRVGRYLRCPYHAWSYELSGRLAAARLPRLGERAGRARLTGPPEDGGLAGVARLAF